MSARSAAVDGFTGPLARACDEFANDPPASPGSPNGNRVIAAMPDFLHRLRAAIQEDNA